WNLPAETRDAILGDLEETFRLVMRRLGVAGSAALVDQYVKPVEVEIASPESVEELGVRG
ncbi:MAG TPA: hypothetical protein VFL82_06940, partial [Thermomicrobiales bacterium]|nr:hypothetical protein [Thermomicrobiales bacterium]